MTPNCKYTDPYDPWSWYDDAIILVRSVTPDGQLFIIEAVSMYVGNGDLGGECMDIERFEDHHESVTFLNELLDEIDEQGMLPSQIHNFAEKKATEGAKKRGEPTPVWHSAGRAEYEAYESMYIPK